MKKMVFALFATLAAPAIVSAAMAEHVGRKKIDGIDVLTYPTAIHDVVTILGALPAGTALALANRQNVSVAVLTAMMLDQGTTKEDKFAIAKRLEGVGATIQFTTRDQPLRIQARCLKKDLPLVLELMAEQLRSPAFNASEFERVRQQYIGELKNRSLRAIEAFPCLVHFLVDDGAKKSRPLGILDDLLDLQLPMRHAVGEPLAFDAPRRQ